MALLQILLAAFSVVIGSGSPDGLRMDDAKDVSVYEIKMESIDGEPVTLGEYEGKVILLVNVASRCGYTPQYEGLEALYREFKDDGLVVVGVPSNDFGGQEPGSDAEIQSFCTDNFGVTFPMMSKSGVLGEDAHPLYKSLREQDKPIGGNVRWNFTKFVIGRDGGILARFEPDAAPDSKLLRRTIGDALAER